MHAHRITPDVSNRTLDGGREFPHTSWVLVAEAAKGRSGDNPAIVEFTERYYAAIRAYIAGIVRETLDADELAQQFFLVVVLSGRLMIRADPAKGRFRAYLKQAIRNFVVDEYRRRKKDVLRDSQRQSSHGKDALVDLPSDSSSAADVELVRTWGKNLVALAIARVQRRCDERGQRQHFELFAHRFLRDPDDPPGWREVGEAFGLDEKTARSRAETVVRHFRAVLHHLIATDIGAEATADHEIQALISLL